MGNATAARSLHGIRFRHPLMRSGIYQQADVTERMAVHAALAETLASEPDRSVWHKTAAPEEEVATRLEGSAARAHRRGAVLVAVAALERSAGAPGPRPCSPTTISGAFGPKYRS